MRKRGLHPRFRISLDQPDADASPEQGFIECTLIHAQSGMIPNSNWPSGELVRSHPEEEMPEGFGYKT